MSFIFLCSLALFHRIHFVVLLIFKHFFTSTSHTLLRGVKLMWSKSWMVFWAVLQMSQAASAFECKRLLAGEGKIVALGMSDSKQITLAMARVVDGTLNELIAYPLSKSPFSNLTNSSITLVDSQATTIKLSDEMATIVLKQLSTNILLTYRERPSLFFGAGGHLGVINSSDSDITWSWWPKSNGELKQKSYPGANPFPHRLTLMLSGTTGASFYGGYHDTIKYTDSRLSLKEFKYAPGQEVILDFDETANLPCISIASSVFFVGIYNHETGDLMGIDQSGPQGKVFIYRNVPKSCASDAKLELVSPVQSLSLTQVFTCGDSSPSKPPNSKQKEEKKEEEGEGDSKWLKILEYVMYVVLCIVVAIIIWLGLTSKKARNSVNTMMKKLGRSNDGSSKSKSISKASGGIKQQSKGSKTTGGIGKSGSLPSSTLPMSAASETVRSGAPSDMTSGSVVTSKK